MCKDTNSFWIYKHEMDKNKKTSKARGEISKVGIKSPKAVVQSCHETHQSSFFAVFAYAKYVFATNISKLFPGHFSSTRAQFDKEISMFRDYKP